MEDKRIVADIVDKDGNVIASLSADGTITGDDEGKYFQTYEGDEEAKITIEGGPTDITIYYTGEKYTKIIAWDGLVFYTAKTGDEIGDDGVINFKHLPLLMKFVSEDGTVKSGTYGTNGPGVFTFNDDKWTVGAPEKEVEDKK